MKKLFTILPIIGLILGAVAIATEIHKPVLIDQKPVVSVPLCPSVTAHPGKVPVLCAE